MVISRTPPGWIRTLAVGAALTGLVLSGGCVASYKGSQPPPQATTLGQELIDLQKARDAGAITDAEYAEQRTRMLGSEAPVVEADNNAL